jgi:tripartite-type tricarboxylate transporter receptor subunit TctC
VERALCCCLVIAGSLGWRRAGRDPEYPSKPLRYIAASAPGGASDLIARTIGLALSEGRGVQAVVDNRPGAGNTIGAEIAARAAPDGYTIFGCNIASLAVSPALYRKLGYDPERDFAPIGLIASNPNALTVHPSLPATTIAQFRAGIGGPDRGPRRCDVFDRASGARGGARRQGPCARCYVDAARSRSAGGADHRRVGMPDFEVTSWQGLCTQAGVPQAALDRIRAALAAALDQPDTRKRLAVQGFQLHVMSAEKFAAFIRAERAKWAKVVKDIGIEPQ